MISTEFNFRSGDGLLLSGQLWRGQGEPLATLICVHGYASHAGRFKKLATSLADQGFVVYAFDWRGHGKSEGLRAYLPSLRRWLDDFRYFLERVPGRSKAVILGQGLGASLALHALHTEVFQPAAMIMLGPGVRRARGVNLFSLAGNRLGSLVLPSLDWSDGLFHWHPSRMFREKHAERDFVNDPFVYHGRFRNRTAHVLDKALKLAMRRAPAVTLPYLLIQGEQDQLFDATGARDFHLTTRSKDKTMKRYDLAGHDLLVDANRSKVYMDILRWLNKRAGKL